MKTLPTAFSDMIRALDIPEPERLLEVLTSTPPSVSIRRHPAAKGDVVAPLHPSSSPVPWSEGLGIYLPERPDFTLDPLLHAGAYYVQDASSMAIAHVIRQILGEGGTPVAYCDACAAPGGKTTAALSVLPEGSIAVANEYVPSRAAVLRENLVKWGDERVVVSVGDTSRFRRLTATFDIIAADVPCSGEGMMRKDDEAVAQWTPELVRQCAARQREILSNLWEALRPGGYLIYSTCTFNTAEDEDMVAWIKEEYGAEYVPVDWPADSGIVVSPLGSRFMPHMLRGEGLFISVLRKPQEHDANHRTDSDRRRKDGANDTPRGYESVRSWIDPAHPGDMSIIERDATLRLFPTRWLPLLSRLEKALKIVSAGVEIASVKGRDIIPAHPLALWRGLRRDAFASLDLSLEDALHFLRKETPDPSLLEGLPKGYVLATYRGVPLGWLKNLGNRANNLYPKEWRILKS